MYNTDCKVECDDLQITFDPYLIKHSTNTRYSKFQLINLLFDSVFTLNLMPAAHFKTAGTCLQVCYISFSFLQHWRLGAEDTNCWSFESEISFSKFTSAPQNLQDLKAVCKNGPKPHLNTKTHEFLHIGRVLKLALQTKAPPGIE